MKTTSALLGSAITAIAILLFALMFGGCAQTNPDAAADLQIPVVPTTLVYSIDAPGGFDRTAIAHSKPKSHKPETFRIEGKAQTITLDQAFLDLAADTAAVYNMADLGLATELGDGLLSDYHSTELSILKAVTCKAIVAHEPLDENNLFSATSSRVYCYTQAALPQGKSGLIQHIWRHEGVEKHRVELFVQGPTYRTSSYKTMEPSLAGRWTIEIATENGDVLDVLEFLVN